MSMLMRRAFFGSNAVSDPYFSNVSLLLSFNGANGSTSATDRSQVANAITFNGDAKISTSQSKFGGSSLYLDGTDDFVTVGSSTAFDIGSGDWTFEAWVYLNTITGDHHILSRYGSSALSPFVIHQFGSGLSFYASGNGSSRNLCSNVIIGESLSTGTWYNIAITRVGASVRTFLNGTLKTTASISGAVMSTSADVLIGRAHSAAPSYFNGYVDEMRITKGVGRYTSTFTVQTSEFPAW